MAASPRVFFGEVLYEPGGSCGPRVQQDYQLVVMVEGVVTAQVEGREWPLAAGEAGLFAPGRREFFRFAPNRRARHTWCSVHPSLVEPSLAESCRAAAPVLPVTRRFEQVMELGLSVPLSAGVRGRGLVESLGLAALHEFLLAGERAQRGQQDEPGALRRALEWIGQNGHTAVDLPALAQAAGVSPAQLVKLFRRHLGATPIRYVWETRTRRGAQLLRETGLTVSEIAFQCGFQTPFHFSRWVRELFGESPRALRTKVWGRNAP
jgi:AraC-like DNA-binding protein